MKNALVMITVFLACSMLILVVPNSQVINAQAEVPAALRYLMVESLTLENVTLLHVGKVLAVHVTMTFALFKVDNTGDKCCFQTHLTRNSISYTTSDWFIQFKEGLPPTIQGAGSFGSGGLLQTQIPIAPYKNQTINNPVDGAQTYYFWRAHFYYDASKFLMAQDLVQLDGAYNIALTPATSLSQSIPHIINVCNNPAPTSENTVILKIQKVQKLPDGTYIVKYKEVKTKKCA